MRIYIESHVRVTFESRCVTYHTHVQNTYYLPACPSLDPLLAPFLRNPLRVSIGKAKRKIKRINRLFIKIQSIGTGRINISSYRRLSISARSYEELRNHTRNHVLYSFFPIKNWCVLLENGVWYPCMIFIKWFIPSK